VLFQIFVIGGVLVGVLFCSLMFVAWKTIIGNQNYEDNDE
jgi:hypothetical protein